MIARSVFDRIFGSTTGRRFQRWRDDRRRRLLGPGRLFHRAHGLRADERRLFLADQLFDAAGIPAQRRGHVPCAMSRIRRSISIIYDNPGQDPEQMVNMAGEPYIGAAQRLPLSRGDRHDSTCKTAPAGGGSITSVASPDGQYAQPMAAVSAMSAFRCRCAIRAGRCRSQRRSPAGAGRRRRRCWIFPCPARVRRRRVRAACRQAGGSGRRQRPLRLVQFGDKVVRVVGPDTPYAQPAGAGT